MTAKNLISSSQLPDPFVYGSLDNNKTYTKELIVLLLIAGYLLYTNQDNQDIQFYLYLTISLLVGFYIIINKTTILDATESILSAANDFIRSIIPGLKSDFEIELEKIDDLKEMDEHYKKINNTVNKIYDESAKQKRELTNEEKENIIKKFFSEKELSKFNIEETLNKIKKYINDYKVNSYKEYNKIKPIIIFNCKKVLKKLKVYCLLQLKLFYSYIEPNKEKEKQLIDTCYKYIDNFNWDEFSKKFYNFLKNPIEETNPFEEINKLFLFDSNDPLFYLSEKLFDAVDNFFIYSEYFVSVIYNSKIYNLSKEFRRNDNPDTEEYFSKKILEIYNLSKEFRRIDNPDTEEYFSTKILEIYTHLKKTSTNLEFFIKLEITEKLIKIYREFIKENLLLEVEKYIDEVKNKNSLLVSGGFKSFFLEAPSNILQFITWIVSYPLDQVKQMFFTTGSSNVSYYFDALTGLINITGSTNKKVVLNSSTYFGKKGIVMIITGSNITYKINGEAIDSISYIHAKPIHTALVLTYMASNVKKQSTNSRKSDSKYLYSIENDKIRLFEKKPDGSQGNEIQSVQMAIRNELEGNYQAAKDARNKVCEKLFGVNESNPICAKHFYTILGKSGLGMLDNLAEPNIKYEILKNLGWKIKVLRNDKQIVNVDEWLETLGQDLKLKYEEYFKNYSHVKIILNKMIEDLNNNTKILDQKYNQSVNTPKPLARKKRLTSAQIAMLRK